MEWRKGEEHRRLRMALNVGFTASAVRKYRPAFEKIAQWASAGLNQEYSN
jgi:cytochrome P450